MNKSSPEAVERSGISDYSVPELAQLNYFDQDTTGKKPVRIPIKGSGRIGFKVAVAPAVALVAQAVPTPIANAADCKFVLGFQTLHDAIPQIVGDCTDNQAFASNGDALQHTTKGLMVWRKADNFTAFTDGSKSWINGPLGIQDRPNTARFYWEAAQPAVSMTFDQKVAKEKEIHPVYTQFMNADGILIKAPAVVDPKGLQKARDIVLDMTSFRPDLRSKLVSQNASLVIIPKNLPMTALPEYSDLSGKNTFDSRAYTETRGAGGIRGRTVTASPEENLLQLGYPTDKYWDEDLTQHEFGHTIMDLGFSDEEMARWKSIFSAAKNGGKFSKYSYDISDENEYWATLTQGYISGKASYNNPSRDAVAKEDPDAYAFLKSVYGPR